METIRFPGRYESLPKVGEFVIQAARRAGLSEKEIYAVELAVDEACSNIIDHAYGGEGVGEMECSVGVQENTLKIILRDTGRPFNPKKIPKPSFNVPIEDLKPRGVGFYLMQKMMDEIHYEHSDDKGNTLTLVKRKKE
jgi:serine/threonine-protein kinase RsbW